MVGNSSSGADLFVEVCQPLSGSPLARQLADLFVDAAEKGWPAALAGIIAAPSCPVLVAYAAIFGLCTWIKTAKGKERAKQMAAMFRRLEDGNVRITAILQSITDHGEVFAKLSHFEQQELADITAETLQARLLHTGHLQQEFQLALREAGLHGDLENVQVFVADTNERVRRIERLLAGSPMALDPDTVAAMRSALLRYAQGPEVRRLRYVGMSLSKKEPPSLDIREVFVPLEVTLRQRRGDRLRPRAKLAMDGPTAEVTRAPFAQEDDESLTTIPFAEAFRTSRALVVLGEPGSGKTTLLRWLAVVAAEDTIGRDLGVSEQCLPLPISIGKLAELRAAKIADHKDPCVVETIADYFWRGNVAGGVGTPEQLCAFLQGELAAGRCLVLLDGLDEVKAQERDGIRNWLETFAAQFSRNRFVVSSRQFGYSGFSLLDAIEVVVRPFTDPQVEAYIRAFCKAYFQWENNGLADDAGAAKEAGTLLAAINANPRLSGLARNPFLLAVIALIHRAVGRLPRHRVQLYQVFAQCLCETWRAVRRMVCDTTEPQMQFEEEALPILGELACRMHEDYPTGRAPREYVLDVLATALQHKMGVSPTESRKAAEKFLKRNAEVQIFLERGPDEWGFLHLTFQEFFVAAGLHAEERFQEVAMQHLFDPRWEEVLRLGVGHMAIIQQRPKAAANFVRRVREYQCTTRPWLTDVLQLQVALATLLAAEAGDALPMADQAELAGQFTDWCVRYAYAESVNRVLAELSLAQFRDRVAAPLTQRLKADTASVRASAAQALGQIKAESAVPALLEALKDEEAGVRASAAYALGEMKAESAVPALLEAMKDKEAGVHWSAAQALGQTKAESAVPALLEALTDREAGVRRSAAYALGEMKAESAVPALLEALKDKEAGVRWRAAQALGQMKAESAVPALLEALKDKEAGGRWSAAQALGQMKAESAVPALLEALTDKEAGVRWSAAQALGEMKAESAVPALLEAMKDKEAGGRRSAAYALGEMKAESAAPALLEAMKDKEAGIRWSAAQALGKMKAESAVPALLEALKDKEAWVRERAAQALGQIKAQSAVPALLEALKDTEAEVRWRAAQALGQIKAQSAVPALLQALKDVEAAPAVFDALLSCSTGSA